MPTKFTERFSADHNYNPKGRLVIEVKLPSATQRYFAITADMFSYRAKNAHACGCLHDEILSVRPDLQDLVDLHLVEADGVPMHAEDLGWYWLLGACNVREEYGPLTSNFNAKTPEACHTFLAKHLSISDECTAEIVRTTTAILRTDGKDAARANFSCFVDELRPEWKAQADAVIAKYSKK